MNALFSINFIIRVALGCLLLCGWAGCDATQEGADPSSQIKAQTEKKEEMLTIEDFRAKSLTSDLLKYSIEAKEARHLVAKNQYLLSDVQADYYNEQGELDASINAESGIQYLEDATVELDLKGGKSRTVSRQKDDIDMFGSEQRPVQWRQADGSFVEGEHIYYNSVEDSFSTSEPSRMRLIFPNGSFATSSHAEGFMFRRKIDISMINIQGYGNSSFNIGASNQTTSDTLKVTSGTLLNDSLTSRTLSSRHETGNRPQAPASKDAALNRKKKFP